SAQGVGDEACRGQDTGQVDAVVPTRGVEEVDQVLGREVARRTGRIRAPTRPAGRRVERPDPGGQGHRGVRQRGPARVVEVVRLLLDRDTGRLREGDELGDLVRHTDADRVAETDLVGTQGQEPDRDIDGGCRVHAAGVGA